MLALEDSWQLPEILEILKNNIQIIKEKMTILHEMFLEKNAYCENISKVRDNSNLTSLNDTIVNHLHVPHL